MIRPFTVLAQQFQLIAVGSGGHLVSSPIDAAVELVKDAVILVQVAELHPRA